MSKSVIVDSEVLEEFPVLPRDRFEYIRNHYGMKFEYGCKMPNEQIFRSGRRFKIIDKEKFCLFLLEFGSFVCTIEDSETTNYDISY